MRYETETYDVYVGRRGRVPSGIDLPFDPDLLKVSNSFPSNDRYPTVMRDLKYEDARMWVCIFKKAPEPGGVKALLSMFPSKYRHPKISEEQAREIAFKEWRKRVAEGEPLEPLDFPLSGDIWWQIGSDNREWQEQGLIPGRVWFHIDKLDGRLLSQDEVNAYYRAVLCPNEM